MEDPEGKEFPWLPKPFTEIIKGKLINSKKEESDWDELKGKVIGLYFSAHWVNNRVYLCAHKDDLSAKCCAPVQN